jgi:phage tail-like protein
MAATHTRALVDRYRDYRFKVLWDGTYVEGARHVGALRRLTSVVDVREGGDASSVQKVPGRTEWEPVTIERSVTTDNRFAAWAALVSAGGATPFHKDVRVEIYSRTGRLVLAYVLHHCWPSAYQALPSLDVGTHATLIETLTLQYGGWERDLSVPA